MLARYATEKQNKTFDTPVTQSPYLICHCLFMSTSSSMSIRSVLYQAFAGIYVRSAIVSPAVNQLFPMLATFHLATTHVDVHFVCAAPCCLCLCSSRLSCTMSQTRVMFIEVMLHRGTGQVCVQTG